MSAYSIHWAWVQALPPVEKLVLLSLANGLSDGDWHHYNCVGIAAFAGVDESRVLAALEYLKRAGAIDRRDEAGLGLVRLLFNEDVAPLQFEPKPLAAWELAGKKQFVYFARSRGLIKIGYSSEPDRRMKSLATTWPHPVRLLKLVPGGKRLEAEYHERFGHLRHVGEWFRADRDLIEFIDSLEGVTA